MSDLHWTVVKLQQMLAERNTAECDASKRDAEHAACRIANESLVHDLMRVMDERDRLQAEVQRLQGQGCDCRFDRYRTWRKGHREGQEAMRERCASRAARDADRACNCGRPICQPDCARVRMLDLADAIRALEVEHD